MNISRIATVSTRSVALAAAAAAAVLLPAAPATAAGAPDEHAPCLAVVFQAQAVGAPQTVALRIREIRTDLLGDDKFGQVLQPLAKAPSTCFG